MGERVEGGLLDYSIAAMPTTLVQTLRGTFKDIRALPLGMRLAVSRRLSTELYGLL